MSVELPNLDKNDLGKGSFGQYRGLLVPKNSRVRLRLAGSNPYQEELAEIASSGDTPVETAFNRRSQQQEGADEPILVRLFTGRRVSGVVGHVPRGLESLVDQALARLAENPSHKQRIPVEIVQKGGLYRVELLMGATRG